MPKHRRRTQSIETAGSADLDDLRRDMIVEIDAAMLSAGWLLVLAAIGFGGHPQHLHTALIVFAGSLGSLWLRRTHLRAALYLPVAACVAAIASQKLLFPQSLAQFCFPVVVVVSSLLASHLSVFVVASMAAIACLTVARLQGAAWLDGYQVVTPVSLIYLTAFAAWLSSRQMHMALGWMQSSYAQARYLLQQLRERRMWQARTLKALEEAYGRIETMNYALIEARSVAEEARRMKAEFAANVSHELRTPLNIVLGFSQTIANAPETYPGVTWTPTLRGDVEHIYQSSRHLAALIDDILDLSALDAHHLGLTLEETDIGSVVAEAVAVVGNLFDAKGLYIAVDVALDLPRLRIDAVRIRQVLINLLTNASRFTHAGGATITSRLVGRELQVVVADTGEGIAPHDVSKVFEDFGQVDGSLARKHEGSGLGVPLSKRLVELHGGRMWLESTPGQGTAFYFTLPIVPQTSLGWAQPPARPPRLAPAYSRGILIVEPDPLMLRTIRRQMSACEIIEVRGPAELPALVERHRPIALVIDRQGESEDASAQDWLADVPADLPVITISLPANLRRAQALGIEGVLIKPVTHEQLLGAIHALGREIHDVLIVDDDPELVELFGRILQSASEKYRPVKAFGGAEALARLRQQPVDLVLLDILMAEVDGLAVLREMKADPALAGTPIIVVSAQYPEPACIAGGLSIQLARAQEASITETLNALGALVETLPPRGLPRPEAVPVSPATPGHPPASSGRHAPRARRPAPAD